ncbi:hypothetical protein MPSEU_000222800 [Mayamaea pseudoterrestris]|nr:hypothetical protein MPSEU_000222800 [Mayamaea pseudoterrestris]
MCSGNPSYSQSVDHVRPLSEPRRKRLVDYSKRKPSQQSNDGSPPVQERQVLGNSLHYGNHAMEDFEQDSDHGVTKDSDSPFKPTHRQSLLASSASVAAPRRAAPSRTKSLDMMYPSLPQQTRRRGSNDSSVGGRRYSNDGGGAPLSNRNGRRYSNDGVIHTRRRNAETSYSIMSTATLLEPEDETIPLNIDVGCAAVDQLYVEPLDNESNHDSKTPKRRGGKRSSKQRLRPPAPDATADLDPLQFMQQYQQKMRRRGSCLATSVPVSKATMVV